MTRWDRHCHVAKASHAPFREHRLTWKKAPLRKKKGEMEEDNGEEDQESARGKPTPIQEVLGVITSQVRKSMRAGDLLQELGDPQKAAALTPNDILHTISRSISSTQIQEALQLKEMLEGGAKPEDVRLKIEQLLLWAKPKAEQKPETDPSLQAEMEQLGGAEAEEKESRWQLFLRDIAKLTNPLYIRLASFLRNPAVRALRTISTEETFHALRDPTRRCQLLQELAGMRHELVFQGSQNLEERRRALHDLSAIFTHSQHLLSPNEEVMLLDPHMRVCACAAALDEYAASLERDKESTQTPDRSLYASKAEQIGKFLEEDRKSSQRALGSKHGQPGLIRRLERAGKESGTPVNVFDILAQGLKKGGWIAELSIPESLKYTCSLIVLEEVGYVYMQIAAGRMAALDPSALQERVKKLALEALQRGVRGARESDKIPFDAATLDPKQQFEELRRKIERKPHPTNEEVNELLLLFEWLRYRGEAPEGLRRQDIQNLRAKVHVGTEELRERTERAREALPLVTASSAVRSFTLDYLIQQGKGAVLCNALEKHEDLSRRFELYVRERHKRNPDVLCDFLEDQRWCREEEAQLLLAPLLQEGNLNLLLAALHGAREEQKCYEEARDALRKLATQEGMNTEDVAKLAHRASRDPETLRTPLNRAYLEEKRRILARTFPSEQERSKRLAALDKAYEDEIGMRQELHLTRIAEWQTILLSALEAEIHVRARWLHEEYETVLRDIQSKGRFAEMKNLDAFGFDTERRETVAALEALEHFELTQTPEPALSAKHAIEQLHALAEAVHRFLEAVRTRTDHLDAARGASREVVVQERVMQNVSPATRKMFMQMARPDAPFESAAAMQGVQFFREHPELLPVAQQGAAEIQKLEGEIAATPPKVAELRSEFESVRGEVLETLKRCQPEKYGISELSHGLLIILAERNFAAIRANLVSAAQPDFPEKEARYLLAEAEREIDRLREFAGTLHEKLTDVARSFQRIVKKNPEVMNEQAFIAFCKKQNLPLDTAAAFDAHEEGSERFVLREKILREHPEAMESILAEEKAHALNYAVAKHLNPRFFLDVYSTVAECRSPLDHRLDPGIQKLFRERAEVWVGVQPDVTSEVFKQWRHDSADELIAKLSVFRQFPPEDSHLSGEDIAFFQELDKACIIPLPRKEKEEGYPNLQRAAAARLPGTQEHPMAAMYREQMEKEPTSLAEGELRGSGEGEGEEGEETAPETVQEGRPKTDYVEDARMSTNLRDCRTYLLKLNAFLEANPAQKTGENMQYIADAEKRYKELDEKFLQRSSETRKALEREIADFLEELRENHTLVEKFDTEQRDVRSVPPTTRGLRGIWQNIEWLSFFDIIRIFKDIGEDIKRQYNRRQEGKIGRVGEGITQWIPSWVPYLGNLHHDFHERKQKAEIDEVEHFKKGLDNVDSYALQELLHHSRNRDQVKAIFFLLTSRGRLDWNDVHMWENLSKLSHYTMPIRECQRNENLREEWLRKIIADIWEDKDLYRKWKQDNDSNIEGEKKKFHDEADRLSNLSGGLAGELEKQLKIFIDCRKRGVPIDNAVHPNLYEEIIDYSIRNGKMTMEQKFYYLIQGIAHGLLSKDRLSVLAGEGGEILQIFPFIDYFYQKNNTMPEIKALAARLWEAELPDDPKYCKPGHKTTLWLELEVAREQHVQERLRKGTDRRANDMDHDDFHFFLPRLDFKTIDMMAMPSGGGKQKITGDAWRNGYIGYNSFFKSFGVLAKLEEEREEAKFGSQDAYQVVKAIAGFVRMDGILTKRSSFDDPRRPTISWGEMKNSYAVYANINTVYQDRALVDTFVMNVLREYKDGQIITQKFIDDLLISTEDRPPLRKEESDAARDASEQLESKLTQALKTHGLGKLKEVLKRHMDRFNVPKSAEGLDYEKAKKIWREKVKAERKFAFGEKEHASPLANAA